MFSSKNIESFNVWTVKIIIFTIPFLTLYISSALPFPFITGKNFVFRILVEFAAALWIGLLAVKKEYRIRYSPIVLSVLTFTFIVGLADLSGVNPYKSFWSNFERMEGYITILHLALYFTMLSSILKTKRDWKVLFTIILLVSVCVSLFPFVFSFNKDTLSFRRFMMEYGTREFSLIGNPPFLASYLLFASFIGLILMFHTQKAYLRFGCIMAVIFNGAVIYLTASRGAILSAIAGIVIFISVFFGRRSHQNGLRVINRTVLFLCVISIIIFGVFFLFSDVEIVKNDQTLSRFTSMFSSDSATSRLNVWKMAWNGIKERPILGWGQENFLAIYSLNVIPLVNEQQWLDRAHNIIIDWLINAGFLGLLSYVAIFVFAFYAVRTAYRKERIQRIEAVIITTALIVYFSQNLFTFDTINTYLIFFTLLAYIDSFESEKITGCIKNIIDSSKANNKLIGASLAALLAFSLSAYYLNYKPINQAGQFIAIDLSFSKNNSLVKLLGDYKLALSSNAFGKTEIRSKMLYVSNYILKNEIFEEEGALEFIQATIEELEKEISINQNNLEYLTEAIMFINKIAIYEKSYINRAEMLIKECMRINPAYQWLYMAQSDIDVLKKDYESAFNNVKKIVDFDPLNDKKQFKLALAAIYASKEDVVKNSLEKVKKIRGERNKDIASGKEYSFTVEELYEIATIYKDVERYYEALTYFEKAIMVLIYEDTLHSIRKRTLRIARMKAFIHLERAKIYQFLGDKEKAMEEAKTAIRLDPENAKKEADKIIG